MSTVENFDGLCGIIARFASSNNQLRCHYELGHHGPCSFEKYRDQFRIWAGANRNEEYYRQNKFIESVLSSLKKS